MNADPHTVWKACKEIAVGLFGHHKNTVSMKMRKQDGNYTDLENAEVFKNVF